MSNVKLSLKELQALQRWAVESESASRLAAMVTLARSEPGIAISHTELDADVWLLNCPNGTVDLRTGGLRPHSRGDLITKLCPTGYDPEAGCDEWVAALKKIFADREELVWYFQRLCGYCLTGDVREQILPVFWGSGSNGKSLIFETVRRVLGPDYAGVGADELVASGHHEPHPTYLADLFGKRLVTLAETREGGRINETLIKKLTGSETVKARRMREDLWEFPPTHKIWLATNHKPEVRGTDHGIWRRLRLIPFTVRFWDGDKGEAGPEHLKADKGLFARLQREAEGILKWMVEGCLHWQAGGLKEPKEIQAATNEYRQAEDWLAAFLSARCELGGGIRVRAKEIYAAYKEWFDCSGEEGRPLSMKRFGLAVSEREGIEKKQSNGWWYHGVRLRDAKDVEV